MKQIGDGSVVSSYFQVSEQDPRKELKDQGSQFLEGQIAKIHYTDEGTNRSKKRVEYDVIARKADGSVSTYKNVPYLGDIQGTNDFSETVLEPNQFAFQGTLGESNKPINQNGTRVVIAFLDTNLDKPVIIGGLSHERRQGAKQSDGIRKKGEFRGICWEINKDGEYIFTYKSPAKPNGDRIRPNTAPTSVKIDTEGNMTFLQSEESGTVINELKYDRTNQKKTETIGKDNSIVEDKDGAAEKMTLTFKSGLTVTIDGAGDKVDIQTNGGANAQVDGNTGTIQLTDNGTGRLKITNDTVALGASSAELLQQISDELQELITLFNTVAPHTHVANLGYPTAPPDTQAAWTTAASNLSTIKGLVDGIKGTL